MTQLQLDELDHERIDFFQDNVMINGVICREYQMNIPQNVKPRIIKLIQCYLYQDGIKINDKSEYVSVKYMYRYHSDGENDFSWGCVYRNFQTLLFQLNIKVPTLRECLKDLISPDKAKLNYNDLIGSKKHLWIEPHDLLKYIQSNYSQYKLYIQLIIYQTKRNMEKQTNLIKQTKKNEEVKYDKCITNTKDIRQIIYQHFKRHKLPIIIDDGEYSYILLAIYCGNNDDNYFYLIGDPHYGMLYGKRDVKKDWNKLGQDSNENNNVFHYGPDYGKMQWKKGEFLENRNKTWMMLFVSPS